MSYLCEAVLRDARESMCKISVVTSVYSAIGVIQYESLFLFGKAKFQNE